MNQRVQPVMIGSFIIVAIALLVIVVLVFARGTFSQEQKNMIYFEGSINGLNIGAPVKLKGVTVGRVIDILVFYDTKEAKIITPVVIEFAARKIFDLEGNRIQGDNPEDMKKLIDHGLRAQLQTQSLLTGQLFIDINFRPNTPVKLLAGDHPLYPEIPSIPSSKEQLENTVTDLAAMLRKLPVQQTLESMSNSIMALEKILKSPEIPSSLAALDHTLKDLQHLVQNLDSKADPIVEGLGGSLKESRSLLEKINKGSDPILLEAREAMKAATGAMNQAQTTLSTIDRAAGQNASLDRAMKDLSSAAQSLRVLAEYLERHPDALIYGKPSSGD